MDCVVGGCSEYGDEPFVVVVSEADRRSSGFALLRMTWWPVVDQGMRWMMELKWRDRELNGGMSKYRQTRLILWNQVLYVIPHCLFPYTPEDAFQYVGDEQVR